MKRHLVIFAKAPQLGRAKRRLALEIGALAAARFYRRTLQQTIGRCARDGRWRTVLCVTPDTASADRFWRAAGGVATVIGQGGGDLGARMARAFRRLPPGPVVLIGSDIPDVSVRIIAAAFASLGRSDMVFGPAADGGFWLIGARRLRAWPRSLFAGVRWSTPHALADTRASLPRRYSVGVVQTLEDIDDAPSYRRWREMQS